MKRELEAMVRWMPMRGGTVSMVRSVLGSENWRHACSAVTRPVLDSHEEQQCDAKYDEECDDSAVAPRVGGATPLELLLVAAGGWLERWITHLQSEQEADNARQEQKGAEGVKLHQRLPPSLRLEVPRRL